MDLFEMQTHSQQKHIFMHKHTNNHCKINTIEAVGKENNIKKESEIQFGPWILLIAAIQIL